MNKYADYRKTSSPFLKTVPSHWIDVKLRHCYTIKSICNTSNEPLLSVFLNRGVVIYTDTDMKQVHKPSEDMKAYQLVLPGDFVLNNQQAWRGSVGVSSHRGIVSPAYIVMSPITENNPRFMNYMLREIACTSQFVLASKGVGSIQRILSPIKLKSCIVVLPPRDEQDQIVLYLDWQVSKINRLIAAKRKQIELLNEQGRVMLRKLVTMGIAPSHSLIDSGIIWTPKIPASWRVVRGKYILHKKQLSVLESDEVVTCFRDGQVCLRSKRRTEGFTNSILEIGYQGIDVGDLAIHGMDGFAGAIGISEDRGKCSPIINVCNTDRNDVYLPYICQYLRMMANNNVFIALSTGIRERSCDLGWNKIANLPFVLPSLQEQIDICSNLETFQLETNKRKNVYQRQIEVLQDLRTRLISDVVTGQIDVRGIEIPEYSACDENASIDQETEEDLCEQGDE